MTLIKAALALALIATQAPAQQDLPCAPRDDVVARLASVYGEARQNVGLGDRGGMIETFVNGENGTFTITVTTAHGQTCFVASGTYFEQVADALPPMGKDGRKIR